MAIMVFDTETTSLEKPFCYNVGYIIVDDVTHALLKEADFVVEQIWHNPELFSTAYYATKRPLYVDAMRKHQTIMDKWGYICQQMIRDIKAFNIVGAYAYNSAFDEKVFDFNCDWFKTINPFDSIPIFDIRGYAHKYLCDSSFCAWCETNSKFNDSGNYSTTAETMYQYVMQDTTLIEEHTALSDSKLEAEILGACVDDGAILGTDYPAQKSIVRPSGHPYVVKVNGSIIHSGAYHMKRITKNNEYNFIE